TDLILDNLIADGKATPMLIVMMDGNTGGGGIGGFGERSLQVFENELKQVLIPFVEQNYRADKSADKRALAGLSMGGLQTLHAGLKNLQIFSYLCVYSFRYINNNKTITDQQYTFMKENVDTINKDITLFWVAMGEKQDIAYENCKVML